MDDHGVFEFKNKLAYSFEFKRLLHYFIALAEISSIVLNRSDLSRLHDLIPNFGENIQFLTKLSLYIKHVILVIYIYVYDYI